MTSDPTEVKQQGVPWRNVLIFIFGFIVTILGISVVLQQWEAVVLVFKAFIGPLLAVTGLVILFSSSLKNHD